MTGWSLRAATATATALIMVLWGCDPAPDDSDADGDGLEAWEEAELGTDPDLADSDGDGYDDLEERDGHTDPLDPTDHPYAGGWPIGACRDDVEATGNDEGQIAEDWTVPDQFGEEVRLHDFCDRAVLLVAGAFW